MVNRIFAAVMSIVLASGCGMLSLSGDTAAAAVLVVSPENPRAYDLHLLVVPKLDRHMHKGMAVVYLPYDSFSYLLGPSSPVGEMSSRELRRQIRGILGISPDRVYITNSREREAAVRVLSRLSGYGGTLNFSYGQEAYQFWNILLSQASALADPRVIAYLGDVYDASQITEKQLEGALAHLAKLQSRLRIIPQALDGHGKIPYNGELLRSSIKQITAGLEGEI